MNNILSDKVIAIIFTNLFDSKNDLNIEAGCLLMNSIGFVIDDKINRATSKHSKGGLTEGLAEISK